MEKQKPSRDSGACSRDRRDAKSIASHRGNAVYQGAAPLSYVADSGSVTDGTRDVFFEETVVRAKTEKRTQLPDFRRDRRPSERGPEMQWREDSVIMQSFDSSAARVRVSGGRTRATLFGASAPASGESRAELPDSRRTPGWCRRTFSHHASGRPARIFLRRNSDD